MDLETLKKLAHYDPETGVWIALQATRGRKAGRIDQQHINQLGYISIQFKKERFAAARLAWLYMTGHWPTHNIDHKNHNPSDNRWSNLREATQSQNMMNSRKRSDNTSGYKRVCWSKEKKKWQVHIQLNGKAKFIGYYKTKEEAFRAYQNTAEKTFGEFACYE